MKKYTEENQKAAAAGLSQINADRVAQVMAKKLPEFIAVQKWLDNEAEIKLKRKLKKLWTSTRFRL